jgi:hypothetical protein
MKCAFGEPRRGYGSLRRCRVGRATPIIASALLALPSAACGRFGYDGLLAAIGGADAGGGPAGGGSGGSGEGGSAGNGSSGIGGSTGDTSVDSGTLPSGSGGASGAAGADSGLAGDGGSAGAPPVPTPTCSDGLQNQDESAVDCGGAGCAPCPCTFGAPELLADPNFAGNDILAVSFSSDALTMYVGGIVQGGDRPIGVTTRPTRGDAFVFAFLLPAPVSGSPAVEGTPFLTRDGLGLYFFSERPGGAGDRDLYVATRVDTGATFTTLIRLISTNSPQRDHAPWLSPDELTLYFSSRRASPDDDVWRATRASRGIGFSAPARVTELESSGNDVGITLTNDGLVAYFASDRAGGAGGMDLYRAARAAQSDPFSTPELLSDLNTSADDAAPQLTADGQELFFVSDRNGSDSQLFGVSRVCP